jgi:SpoVK/Ycf46/Vps4 family AAA+-type ATPase
VVDRVAVVSGTDRVAQARAIARERGKDLRVVGKWIGETEKNLARLLQEAEEQDVILLLDEGDALLGKRTEVRDSHDRYANVEVSYLQRRIEAEPERFVVATGRPARPAWWRRFLRRP